MADTVASNVLADTRTHHVIHLVCASDATGESLVLKVDKSAIGVALPVGQAAAVEAVALDIAAVRWAIQGFSSVKLFWDHATDDLALVLAGSGYEDFTGKVNDYTSLTGLKDPKTADSTGDILLTSVGASATATYDITLTLRKRAA